MKQYQLWVRETDSGSVQFRSEWSLYGFYDTPEEAVRIGGKQDDFMYRVIEVNEVAQGG